MIDLKVDEIIKFLIKIIEREKYLGFFCAAIAIIFALIQPFYTSWGEKVAIFFAVFFLLLVFFAIIRWSIKQYRISKSIKLKLIRLNYEESEIIAMILKEPTKWAKIPIHQKGMKSLLKQGITTINRYLHYNSGSTKLVTTGLTENAAKIIKKKNMNNLRKELIGMKTKVYYYQI